MDIVSYSHADKQQARIKKFITEPDNISGLVTMPKTIVSGETATIPEDRIVVHPNLQVDGTLEVYGDLFVPAGSTFGHEVKEEFTATDGQTVFTMDYPIGFVSVYVNGVKLASSDYVATSGTSVVLNAGAEVGDIVEIIAFGTFSMMDAYERAEVDTLLDTRVAKTGDETIAGIKTFTSPPVVDGKQVSTGQRKNYLINGNFDMWQRGSGGIQVNAAPAYGADMWKSAVNAGSYNVYGGLSSTGYGISHCVSQQTTTSTYGYSETYIESYSAKKMVGNTVTLSFSVYNDSGSTYYFGVNLSRFNVADVSTATTLIQSNSFTHPGNSTWVKYTQTYTNLPVGTENGLVLQIAQSNGLVVGKVFGIDNLKLEDGSVANDGWHPYDGEFGGEIQACQRYYEVLQFLAEGYSTSGTTIMEQYKNTKRITPIVTEFSGAGTNVASIDLSVQSVDLVRVRLVLASAGYFSRVSYITASAEL